MAVRPCGCDGGRVILRVVKYLTTLSPFHGAPCKARRFAWRRTRAVGFDETPRSPPPPLSPSRERGASWCKWLSAICTRVTRHHRPLVRLDARLLDQLCPFRNFGPNHCGELIG